LNLRDHRGGNPQADGINNCANQKSQHWAILSVNELN
jgi:hypothetical protein